MSPLSLRLRRFSDFTSDELDALERLSHTDIRIAQAGQEIVREGRHQDTIAIVLEGWACRFKLLQDGRRQIIGLLLPGDFLDLNVFLLQRMDHSIGALTRLRCAHLDAASFEQVGHDHPRILKALALEALVSAAIQRELTLSLGQRTALERTAHLICELVLRLRAVGLAAGQIVEFPLTQVDLADVLGLSTVHINRTLQELRARQLVFWGRTRVEIRDLPALMRLGLFNPNYLHLEYEGNQFANA